MNELTQRLSNGDHPVIIGSPKISHEELRDRLESIGYVNIKFTGTNGGTDLSMKVDLAASDLSGADFDQGSGALHVEGTLSLNYDPVRCIADIDLATFTGTGHLQLTEEHDVVG